MINKHTINRLKQLYIVYIYKCYIFSTFPQLAHIIPITCCTMKQLPFNIHHSIISMLENGDSCCQIAARLGVGHFTVSKLHSQITSSLKENAGGHPSKLSLYDCCKLVQLITTGKADTASQLQHKL